MKATSPNDSTIEAYNHSVDCYIRFTPSNYLKNHAPLLKWIDHALGLLPKDAVILEIGSGTGREARYIKNKGFNVTCSDAAPAFVDYLRSTGEKSITLNAIKDPLPGKYNMIFANAVVPHFTPNDLESLLIKAYNSLKTDGLFAFSVKQGVGDTWITEKLHGKRFIHYWQPDEIALFVKKRGYEVIFLEHNIPGDLPTHTWINLTAKR